MLMKCRQETIVEPSNAQLRFDLLRQPSKLNVLRTLFKTVNIDLKRTSVTDILIFRILIACSTRELDLRFGCTVWTGHPGLVRN
jgi:hypothetical protein